MNSKLPRTLPPFLQKMLEGVPDAGAGVHRWLFNVSRHLHAYLPADEITALLETLVANCGRIVPRREIEAAVKDSMACAMKPGKQNAALHSKPKWPGINLCLRSDIIREGDGLVDLWEASRTFINDGENRTEEIVDRLFPGNPLLCCGKSSSVFDTRPRELWRGQLSRLQFIVPSPMSAVTGTTKDGRLSKHCLDNTGDRRFLICEFDSGTTDEHAALLLHLGTFAPLVCAVHSGGKSLHGWFYVQGQPCVKVEKFFCYAVSLGADHATWTRCQFVRMPDGTRDNGNRQTVFFLNFKPVEETQ